MRKLYAKYTGTPREEHAKKGARNNFSPAAPEITPGTRQEEEHGNYTPGTRRVPDGYPVGTRQVPANKIAPFFYTPWPRYGGRVLAVATLWPRRDHSRRKVMTRELHARKHRLYTAGTWRDLPVYPSCSFRGHHV